MEPGVYARHVPGCAAVHLAQLTADADHHFHRAHRPRADVEEEQQKAYRLTVVIVSCLVLAIFLFPLISILFNIQSEFVEQMTARLIEEPVAIFNRAMGNEFRADKLDSMDWRAEASERAYYVYVNILEPDEQIFGIGLQGFYGTRPGLRRWYL